MQNRRARLATVWSIDELKTDFNFRRQRTLTRKADFRLLRFLLEGKGNDGQIRANGSNFCRRRHPQWQATRVVGDPRTELKLVRLRIIGGEGELDCRNLLSAQLDRLFAQRLNNQGFRFVINE